MKVTTSAVCACIFALGVAVLALILRWRIWEIFLLENAAAFLVLWVPFTIALVLYSLWKLRNQSPIKWNSFLRLEVLGIIVGILLFFSANAYETQKKEGAFRLLNQTNCILAEQLSETVSPTSTNSLYIDSYVTDPYEDSFLISYYASQNRLIPEEEFVAFLNANRLMRLNNHILDLIKTNGHSTEEWNRRIQEFSIIILNSCSTFHWKV